MSKILINNTASTIDIVDVGIELNVGGQYTIVPTDYDLVAASDNLVTLVGNVDVIVNDGSTNLSISNGIDLIKGIFPLNISILGVDAVDGTLSVSAENPSLSSKIRVDFSNTKQDLPRNTETILDYYTYTGTGTLYGFSTYFNSNQVTHELVIDDEIIFSFDLDDFDDFIEEDELLPFFKLKNKQISYEPTLGIKFNSSVKLRARASTSSSSKDMKIYVVNIEKVT